MSDVIISIIGAGVIGASLGQALRRMEDPPTVIGHDKDLNATKEAFQMGAFDKTEWNLINTIDKADLIILAIPAGEVEKTLTAIKDYLKDDCVITDTCTVKAPILAQAERILPDHAHFVGGHPIVAGEGNGPTYARADLFKDALYCLTPAVNVTPDAVRLLEELVRLVGAVPFYLDAAEHDGLVSVVQDLPTVLSLALMQTAGLPPTWRETRKLAGGLFAKTTAGAVGDPDDLAAHLLSNKATVQRLLTDFETQLQALRTEIEKDDLETLAAYLDQPILNRREWLADFKGNKLSDLAAEQRTKVEKPNLIKQFFGIGRRED